MCVGSKYSAFTFNLLADESGNIPLEKLHAFITGNIQPQELIASGRITSIAIKKVNQQDKHNHLTKLRVVPELVRGSSPAPCPRHDSTGNKGNLSKESKVHDHVKRNSDMNHGKNVMYMSPEKNENVNKPPISSFKSNNQLSAIKDRSVKIVKDTKTQLLSVDTKEANPPILSKNTKMTKSRQFGFSVQDRREKSLQIFLTKFCPEISSENIIKYSKLFYTSTYDTVQKIGEKVRLLNALY